MGTWISSNSGNITFNSSHLVGYSVYNQGRLDFACLELIGTYYILLSSQFSLFSSPAIAMMCVGFTNIKPSLFKYVIYTSILTDANNQRIRFADNSTTVSTGMACTDLGSTDYYLLMKDGQLDVVKEQCPDVFLGQFSFTFNSTDCANNTGLMDGCTDLQTLSFNYSSCSTVQAYSSGGSVNCVYSTTEGDITYLTVYNPDNTTDEVTYFSFTCYVIEKTSSSSYMYATQHPQDCHSNQTSTYVPAPGANLTMLSSVTCVPSAATPATASLAEASLIAGLVVGFILLLLLVLLVICFYCYKKKTKIQPGKAPIDTAMPVLVKKEKEKEDSDKEEDGFGILRIEGHHREVPPHSTEANPPTPGGPRRDPMNEGPYHGLERQMSKEISLHFQDIQELEHARDLCHARELNHAREQEHARERARVQPVDVEDCPLSKDKDHHWTPTFDGSVRPRLELAYVEPTNYKDAVNNLHPNSVNPQPNGHAANVYDRAKNLVINEAEEDYESEDDDAMFVSPPTLKPGEETKSKPAKKRKRKKKKKKKHVQIQE